MPPQSGLSATTLRLPIDIRRLPWIRRLAADYAFDYGRLADFFAGNPANPAAWRDAVGRTLRYSRNRDEVADRLLAQQQRRGAPPEALAAARQLRDPQSVAIVTGQQAGLFGGPLFTILKALTAIRLAERVREEQHVPAVAIFWIDGEDHDWDEVKSCSVLDGDLNLRKMAVGDLSGAHQGPVGRVRLDPSVAATVDEVESVLQTTEFTPQIIAALRQAYRSGAGMAEAFGQWLESVLGPRGLIVYDSADAAFKPLVADVFRREVDRTGETARLAAAAGAALQALGYHAQVAPHEGGVALFHMNGGRQPIRQQGEMFLVGDRTESKEALLDRVRHSPEHFSPSVLLRPLVQDTLFPTVCYVAGPNELGYLGQLGRIYDAFGIPMPLIHQRATATILDSNAMRFLTRHELPLESLQAQDEAALNGLLEAQLPPGVDASLQDALHAIEVRMHELAKAVLQIDPTLEAATRSTLARMQDDLKKLHSKIIQAAKRKDETLRRQYRHAQVQAFPGGQPQERELGCIYFLNKYGPVLIDRLSDELPLDMGHHWVVTI